MSQKKCLYILREEKSFRRFFYDGTVLHQVLDMAVDDDYIRSNPSDNVLKELKQSHCFQTEKRRGLTVPEQELFLEFLQNSYTYSRWYPLFAVMIRKGYAYIKEHINWSVQSGEGTSRVEVPEIPVEAIREIVVNSFAHADYRGISENEIVITPTRVLACLLLDNKRAARHVSARRLTKIIS